MKKRILIAEDEPSLVHALQMKLAHEGFETVVAKDGGSAIASIKAQRPDLLLLDLMMPNVDGYAVLEFLRKENVKLPTIIATNLSTGNDIARANALGAMDYIVKSDTTLSEIIEKIRSYL